MVLSVLATIGISLGIPPPTCPLKLTFSNCSSIQAPVVRKVDNAIHRINHYPVDSAIGFRNVYPLDSDLSGG